MKHPSSSLSITSKGRKEEKERRKEGRKERSKEGKKEERKEGQNFFYYKNTGKPSKGSSLFLLLSSVPFFLSCLHLINISMCQASFHFFL
jgi:hypothetical protein